VRIHPPNPLIPSQLIDGNIADADPLVEYPDVDVGVDNEDGGSDAVQDIFQQTIYMNPLSAAGETRLGGMMDNYRDIWAIKLGGHR
jgi:hypothetical protein